MANKLLVHPAFYRRVRHYRDRIALREGRPQVAVRFVRAAEDLVVRLLKNPQRGHSARFEAPDLADILRCALPGFSVFALFYRWDGQTLTVITLEHTAQDLPSRLAGILSAAERKREETK
jgi:plasmid stabilization system protein ParE